MYRFKDQKGFIARPKYAAIVTLKQLKWFQDLFYSPDFKNSLKTSEQNKLDEVFAAIEKLPQATLDKMSHGDVFDLIPTKEIVWADFKNQEAKFVLIPDNFTTSTGNPPNIYPKINEKGWDDLDLILSAEKLFKKMHSVYLKQEEQIQKSTSNSYSSRKTPLPFSFNALKKAQKLQNLINDGQVSIQEFNPTSDLVSADCFAIYVGTNQGGFLDGRGQFAPLGGARLFESQASAEKTISSRGLTGVACVVCIQAQMTEMAPNQHNLKGNFSDLREAISHIQKQQILNALNEASEEELQEAVQRKRKRM